MQCVDAWVCTWVCTSCVNSGCNYSPVCTTMLSAGVCVFAVLLALRWQLHHACTILCAVCDVISGLLQASPPDMSWIRSTRWATGRLSHGLSCSQAPILWHLISSPNCWYLTRRDGQRWRYVLPHHFSFTHACN